MKYMYGEVAVTEATLRRLRAERDQEVSAFMERLGLDVLVGLSGGARGQRAAVRFLANYATNSQTSCLVWARNEAPRLVLPYSVFLYDAEGMSWIEDIQVDADYPAAIARYLGEHGRTKGRLGWVGPPLLLQSVRSDLNALPLQMESVTVQAPFSEMTATKTPEELLLMRRGAAITDQVLRMVGEKARAGVTDRDLVAEAEYLARRLGTEGAGSLSISKGTSVSGPVRDQALQPGDVFQFSVEPEGPAGFWMQTIRMYAVGERPKEAVELVERGLEAERRAAALLRDGCRVADVADTMLEVMGQKAPDLAVQLGHGIGLDMAEPPRITAGNQDILRTNMTVVIHPSEIGKRYAMFLGDTFLIKGGGAEKLSEIPNELFVV